MVVEALPLGPIAPAVLSQLVNGLCTVLGDQRVKLLEATLDALRAILEQGESKQLLCAATYMCMCMRPQARYTRLQARYTRLQARYTWLQARSWLQTGYTRLQAGYTRLQVRRCLAEEPLRRIAHSQEPEAQRDARQHSQRSCAATRRSGGPPACSGLPCLGPRGEPSPLGFRREACPETPIAPRLTLQARAGRRAAERHRAAGPEARGQGRARL